VDLQSTETWNSRVHEEESHRPGHLTPQGRELWQNEIVAGVKRLWKAVDQDSPAPTVASGRENGYRGVYASSLLVHEQATTLGNDGPSGWAGGGPDNASMEAAFAAVQPIVTVEKFRLLLEHAIIYNSLLALFQEFDVNKDGVIDIQEFVVMVTNAATTTSQVVLCQTSYLYACVRFRMDFLLLSDVLVFAATR